MVKAYIRCWCCGKRGDLNEIELARMTIIDDKIVSLKNFYHQDWHFIRIEQGTRVLKYCQHCYSIGWMMQNSVLGGEP